MTVRIWGHRGCRGLGNPPENSLAAFQAAIDQGADGVELDIFLTKDNQLVVFHDDTLDRMTDGIGNIKDYTLEELKKLRLKSDGGKGPLTGEQIPTYQEVLDLIEHYRTTPKKSPEEAERAKNFVVNTEIKGLGIADHVAKSLEERLQKPLEKGKWKPENFYVSSFDMTSLREMRKSQPSIPIGALFEGGQAPWDISQDKLARYMEETRDIHPDTVNITLPSLTPNAIKLIKEAGAIPVAWTSGEIHPAELPATERLARMKLLKENDITFITDYPSEARRMLKIS